jgi:hypothetical protein
MGSLDVQTAIRLTILQVLCEMGTEYAGETEQPLLDARERQLVAWSGHPLTAPRPAPPRNSVRVRSEALVRGARLFLGTPRFWGSYFAPTWSWRFDRLVQFGFKAPSPPSEDEMREVLHSMIADAEATIERLRKKN